MKEDNVPLHGAETTPKHPIVKTFFEVTETRNCILAVDPGASGAMALYHPDGALPTPADPFDKRIIGVWDFPTRSKMHGRGVEGRKILDLPKLAILVESFAARVAVAVIEDVGARPKQGVSSTFHFGLSTGQVHGILAANYIPMMFLHPAVWKSGMGLNDTKQRSLDRVEELFPAWSKEHCKFRKDHNKAEALLLAVWGARMFK